LLPAASLLGSGYSVGLTSGGQSALTSGQLATNMSAAGGTSTGESTAMLPVQPLATAEGAPAGFILARNIYADHELAMYVIACLTAYFRLL